VHGAAACVTVKVIPAMVSEPVRGATVLFWVIVYPTLPLPVPDGPNEMVKKLELLLAVHGQFDALAEMLTTESLLADVKLALAGVS